MHFGLAIFTMLPNIQTKATAHLITELQLPPYQVTKCVA
jgi:hypothetical protein